MSGILKAVLLSLHLHQQNHRLYLGFWAFTLCIHHLCSMQRHCHRTQLELLWIWPAWVLSGKRLRSTGDLATKSGRIGAILYKGVLTNFVSSSENSAESCLCEAALSEYILPGKYSPARGTAFSFSVFRWLVFTNLSRLTIAAGVIPGIRLTAPICMWRQEQVNHHQTYTLELVRNEIKTRGYSFPCSFHAHAPWEGKRDFTAAQPCCGWVSHRLRAVWVQLLPHLCGEWGINGKVIQVVWQLERLITTHFFYFLLLIDYTPLISSCGDQGNKKTTYKYIFTWNKSLARRLGRTMSNSTEMVKSS